MLAGTIAVLTEVLVTNMKTEPEWVVWVLPTVITTPAIIWWNIKILSIQKINWKVTNYALVNFKSYVAN